MVPIHCFFRRQVVPFVPYWVVDEASVGRRFFGSSLDKPVLASVWLHGGAEGKAQRGREIKC
jgi:hypothetical protein